MLVWLSIYGVIPCDYELAQEDLELLGVWQINNSIDFL